MAIEYKYECYWSQKDGLHFSFRDKRLWEIKGGYRVADETNKDQYVNLITFTQLEKALEYMRTT